MTNGFIIRPICWNCQKCAPDHIDSGMCVSCHREVRGAAALQKPQKKSLLVSLLSKMNIF